MKQFIVSYVLGLVFIVGTLAGVTNGGLKTSLIEDYRDAVAHRAETLGRGALPNRIFDHFAELDAE